MVSMARPVPTTMRYLLTFLLAAPLSIWGQPFYSDDPLWAEPPPTPIEDAAFRDLSDIYDYFLYTFTSPEERHKDVQTKRISARAVNTLGEVPDSQWFTNRIDRRDLSIEELVRGPGDDHPPSPGGRWTIVSAKNEGHTPGFVIEDETGERFVFKFDPWKHAEMASGADYLGSRFFHALGYWVPQNYLVDFRPERLTVREGVMITDPGGRVREMLASDVAWILQNTPKRPDGTVRALASRYLKGKPLGGFRYHGTRDDDPDDIVAHEHRRDLRGLYVFASWLGHDDSRGVNTIDMLVEEAGRKFVRHHLIDFGSLLGSASEEPNSPRGGNEYLYDPAQMFREIFSLGLYAPRWYRHDYAKYPSIGRFEHEIYQPDRWKPEYRNPAFTNRLPDDTFWAAKKVAAFTDEALEALVASARYSDKEAADWLVACLKKRRDRVGREYFSRVLPLDRFKVDGGVLLFEHLGEKYGYSAAPKIRIEWSEYDNATGPDTPLDSEGARVPTSEAEYLKATLSGPDKAKTVTAYLRATSGGHEVVGLQRDW